MKRSDTPTAFTLVELLVILGAAAMMLALLLPTAHRARQRSNTEKCSDNLRQIGQAMLLYANENRHAYPRTYYVPDADMDWSNTGHRGKHAFDKESSPTGTNNVPAALFLLIRTQNIGSELFLCPATDDQRDDYEGAPSPQERANFTDIKKNLSYSIAEPYPTVDAVKKGYRWNSAQNPEFALMADKNPGVSKKDDGSDVTLSFDDSSSRAQLRRGNSHNHDQEGQNVLFGDGHVEFMNTPRAGFRKDNIYATASHKFGPAHHAQTPHDSYLVPADD